MVCTEFRVRQAPVCYHANMAVAQYSYHWANFRPVLFLLGFRGNSVNVALWECLPINKCITLILNHKELYL